MPCKDSMTAGSSTTLPWSTSMSEGGIGGGPRWADAEPFPEGHRHSLQLFRGHESRVLPLSSQLLVALTALLQRRVPACSSISHVSIPGNTAHQ